MLSFTDDDEPDGLSFGVIIGIVVAAVIAGTAAVLVILVVVYVCSIRPRKSAIHDGNSRHACIF